MASIQYLTFAPVGQRNGKLHSDIASMRYRVIIPMTQLARRGHRFHVGCIPANATATPDADKIAADTVIFSKSSTPLNEALAQALKARGKKIVVDLCDNYFEHLTLGEALRKHHVSMCRLADVVVASTPELATLIHTHTGIPARVVSDPVEGPAGMPAFNPEPSRLKLLWFGHQSNVGPLNDLMPVLAETSHHIPIELVIMTKTSPAFLQAEAATNRQFAPRFTVKLIEWQADAVWLALRNCDMVLIPSPPGEYHAVKSPNRIAEALRAGRYVVANPLPSYEPFRNAAWLGDDIGAGIREALENRDRIAARIRAGQAYVETHHAPAVIASHWETALNIASTLPGPH